MGRLWATLTHPDFPYRRGSEPMPYIMQAIFWISIASIVFALVVAIMAAFDTGQVEIFGQTFGARQLYGEADGLFVWIVGGVGLLLAYGIWSERKYPRALSMVAVLAALVWMAAAAFRSGRFSLESVVIFVAGATALKSLAISPDIKAYYNRDQDGRPSRP